MGSGARSGVPTGQGIASGFAGARAIQGRPYRLYSDAYDFAMGASLQQVQLIAVRDLKGHQSTTDSGGLGKASCLFPSCMSNFARMSKSRPNRINGRRSLKTLSSMWRG
jgi:hypothetical protein